jgi:hypothetical protein
MVPDLIGQQKANMIRYPLMLAELGSRAEPRGTVKAEYSALWRSSGPMAMVTTRADNAIGRGDARQTTDSPHSRLG